MMVLSGLLVSLGRSPENRSASIDLSSLSSFGVRAGIVGSGQKLRTQKFFSRSASDVDWWSSFSMIFLGLMVVFCIWRLSSQK